jgi:glycosyltransferase involved in cell wall biosynthesis
LAVGLPVARILGKPILMKIAGSGVVPLLSNSTTGRLELYWLRRWARYVMILNEGMRQEAISHGFSQHQLQWMPNPVATDEFSPCSEIERRSIRSQFGIPFKAPVVLYCGRLAQEKALPSLLDAFALVSRQVPEAILVLVGDGLLRTALVNQARQLNMTEKNVRFTGRVDPGQVSSWLKIADAFTLVSFSEGFACALVEAMSTGLACVVSDIPANRQLIQDGEHGFLAPVGNSEAIAGAILRLLLDTNLRIRMGDAARRSVLENYATSRIADRYEALFRRMLGP